LISFQLSGMGWSIPVSFFPEIRGDAALGIGSR